MKKIVIVATVAAPFFVNAWGLGDRDAIVKAKSTVNTKSNPFLTES